MKWFAKRDDEDERVKQTLANEKATHAELLEVVSELETLVSRLARLADGPNRGKK